MARRKPRRNDDHYPKPVKTRVGCKVSWNYYRTEAEAEACAEAAKRRAVVQARLGYDFGYCAPGSIRVISSSDDDGLVGLYEVCLP